MIPLQNRSFKRPGIVIPVFFLCLHPMMGQVAWQEASVESLGNTFVTRTGYCHARHNQAGLAWIEKNSLTLQHSRPFILKELGISILSCQFQTGAGAFGATLSRFGIEGFNQSSAWISYGMKLQHGISMGLGIHFWTTGIPGQMIFHPGFSFALGIQARINDQFAIGAHVLHPIGWYSINPGDRDGIMVISVGGSYTFLESIIYYSDLRIMPGNHLQSCHAIELKNKHRLGILMGLHNQPFGISGGIVISFRSWTLHAACKYLMESGIAPSSSFTYVW